MPHGSAPPSSPVIGRVSWPEDVAAVVAKLGLAQGCPTLVLIGGAGALDGADLKRLAPLFDEAVVPAVTATGACVVDGGTDSGVMRLMGEARTRAQGSFALVGVAVEALVAVSGGPVGGEALDSNHTHMVLVPGARWGDETPWLGRVAAALAVGAPSLTLVIDGGEIARRDAAASVLAGRPVIAVAGSGRTADWLAAGGLCEPLVSAEAADDPAALRRVITETLAGMR